MSTLHAGSRVRLHPLIVRPEDGEYVVGSLDNGEFVAVPEVGKRAIELLGGDRNVGQAGEQLREEYDAEVDLADFVEQLCDLGFVSSIDDRPVTSGLPVFRPNLPRLRAGHVRWLFSRPFGVLYVAVVVAAAIAVASRPGGLAWLHYDTLLWPELTSLVMVTMIAMAGALAALHELAHLVAARSLGLPSRVDFSTRLVALVVVTDVRCLWAVPPRQRYRVYLAGMASDLLMISLAQLLAAVVAGLRAPLDALSLVAVLAMLNQLQLYMRTDLYLVATTLARTKNLYQDASVYLLDRVRRGWHRLGGRGRERPDPLAALSAREATMARGYAVVMVAGSAIALGVALTVAVPTLVAMFARAVASIGGGEWAGVADGAATVLVLTGLQVLFLVALVRGRAERVRRLRQRLR